MALPDAATVVAKWQSRASAASGDYVSGAQTTDKDPTALAIANGQRYIQQVNARFTDGTWANALRRSGKSGWIAGIESKGATNYQSGIAAAGAKAEAAFARLLSYESGGLSRISSMPNVSAGDRKNRMNAWFDYMSAYPKA